MAANQFAWRKFKWRVATLLDAGSVMNEDGILRYRTIDKRRPLLLSMAQKRIDLMRRCEDLKQERKELQEKERGTEYQASQAEDRLRNHKYLKEQVDKDRVKM